MGLNANSGCIPGHSKYREGPRGTPQDASHGSCIGVGTSHATTPTIFRGTPHPAKNGWEVVVDDKSIDQSTLPWLSITPTQARECLHDRGGEGHGTRARPSVGIGRQVLPPIYGLYAISHFVQVDTFFLGRHKAKFGPRN